MRSTFMRPDQKHETQPGSSLPELLEQVRLLDTRSLPIERRKKLVSQLQEAYAAKDSKRLEQEGKLLEAVQEMQDRTGVTSGHLPQVFLQSR